jgi:hypothetical protein
VSSLCEPPRKGTPAAIFSTGKPTFYKQNTFLTKYSAYIENENLMSIETNFNVHCSLSIVPESVSDTNVASMPNFGRKKFAIV